MENKLIVRIAEGLGNQMFMYAHSYALSKKINYKLLIDNKSAYFKQKDIRSYQLHNFNISTDIADEYLLFNNHVKNLKRKFLIKIDKFKSRKKFLIEKKDKNKITKYEDTSKGSFFDLLYVEGYYESEKYFKEFEKDLKSKFILKNDLIDRNNKFIELLKNNNSVSIAVRQNRYSERRNKNIVKSTEFTKNSIVYIKKAVSFFKNKISNPKFFIWSNDFTNLNNYFNQNEFTFIVNDNNKSLNDFNLFKYSKHFIVGPTSFHWWGAWLNKNPDKICLRLPEDLNPSNNKNFWPESWITI